MSTSANGEEYYLDGYYYSPAFGIGGGFNAVITDITPYENYYFVTYDVHDLEGFSGDLINHCFAVVQRKIIEGTGTGYWSLYYYRVLAEGETIDLPSASTSAPAISADNFTDVKQSDYFYSAVRWGVEQGIIAGSGANTFSPNDTCTKAQILTFLWRANGSPEPTKSNPFNDVSESKYYYKADVWANEKGMVYPGAFGADEPCTRAMTVAYLWKLAGSPVVEGNTFSDVPSSADYAPAVLWAVDKGITSGTGGTAFSPNAVCTRAQIITFLYRNAGYETAVKPDLTSNGTEKDEGWKSAYIKLIREQYYTIDSFGSPIEIYKLVDVNGDDIPELYIETGITAAGSRLCTYYKVQ